MQPITEPPLTRHKVRSIEFLPNRTNTPYLPSVCPDNHIAHIFLLFPPRTTSTVTIAILVGQSLSVVCPTGAGKLSSVRIDIFLSDGRFCSDFLQCWSHPPFRRNFDKLSGDVVVSWFVEPAHNAPRPRSPSASPKSMPATRGRLSDVKQNYSFLQFELNYITAKIISPFARLVRISRENGCLRLGIEVPDSWQSFWLRSLPPPSLSLLAHQLVTNGSNFDPVNHARAHRTHAHA